MSAIAILHPTTLLGKELRETLDRRATSWVDVRLLSTHENEIGTLTEVAGAAAVVQRYEPESLAGVSTAFFCGPIERNRPLLAELPADALAVILSFDATVEDGEPVVAGINTAPARRGRPLLSPHPAVVLLAHLLHPLTALGLELAVATVVQPASMEGDAGLEELFEQTREIVAMTSRSPTPVFGSQLSFNLLPAVPPADPLAAQLGAVLAAAPPVALQVVQGGIFHGISASVYVRLGGSPGSQTVRKAFAGNPHLEMAEDPKHLGPIDAAASEKVLVGTVRKAADGGFWLWAVMDNLTRGGALNALEIAEAVGALA
jgi:aspartate-semialdehyde dehydrogenase